MFRAFLGYVKVSGRCSGVFRGVPGFLEGVPGCSGFFSMFRVFRDVPGCSGVPCSAVPLFRCSAVPLFRCSVVPGITTCHITILWFSFLGIFYKHYVTATLQEGYFNI